MMANDAGFPNDTGTFTRQEIFTAAQARWLTVEEIIAVLNDAKEDEWHQKQYGIPKPGGAVLERQTAPPASPPPSGTVLLYDRVAVRNYKVDGHEWVRKRSNQTKIREDHVKLRYNGIHRISGTYVHSDEIDTLHRRVYRLIKTAEEKAAIAYGGPIKQEFVLVQYLDTDQAKNIASMTAPSLTAKKSARRSTKTTKRSRSSRNSSYNSLSSSSSYSSSTTSSSSTSDEEYQPTKAVAAAAAASSSSMSSLRNEEFQPQVPKRQRTDSNTYAKAIDKPFAWNPLLTSSVLTNSFGRARPKCSQDDGPRNDAALDDIHFDDLWDMIESDSGLGRGLEALIDPRVNTVVEQARKQEQEEQSLPKYSSLQYQVAVTNEMPQAATYQKQERHGRPQDCAKNDPSFSNLFDRHKNNINMKQPYYNSQMASTHTADAAAPATGTSSTNQQHYHPQPQEKNPQGNGCYDNYIYYNGAEASAPPQHQSAQQQQQQQQQIYDAYGEEVEPYEV
jgi:hypothetical protein